VGDQQQSEAAEEVDDMAATIDVVEESGTWTGVVHPHNGYYAGDFSTPRTEPTPRPRTS
jgi:hypothetical protein